VRLRAAPGRQRFGPTIAAFDRRVDELLEPVREHHALGLVFNVASEAGDFSLIWHVVSLGRGIVKRRPRQVVALALALGVESLIVNQGLKRIFRRERPTAEGDPRYHVRRPVTSSFPSGHASAGAFAATVLTGWDGRRSAPPWYALAGTVGASRAVVRIHHASDVVGGIVVGTAMGMVARRVLRRWASG
jgi:membrane-associated phospholipid phosphatase